MHFSSLFCASVQEYSYTSMEYISKCHVAALVIQVQYFSSRKIMCIEQNSIVDEGRGGETRAPEPDHIAVGPAACVRSFHSIQDS